MKTINLPHKLFAIVDDEYFDEMSKYKWCIGARGYAIRSLFKNGHRSVIYMHREIIEAAPGIFCDHINGNKLDNRKSNLRLVTNQQNLCNRKTNSNNTSGYKGVSFQGGKWHAKITANNIQHHLGYFETALEAAIKYDEASRKYHGDFSSPNFKTKG